MNNLRENSFIYIFLNALTLYDIYTKSKIDRVKVLSASVIGVHTVCPGSSDPPEKMLIIFASENEAYTIFNYYDILG